MNTFKPYRLRYNRTFRPFLLNSLKKLFLIVLLLSPWLKSEAYYFIDFSNNSGKTHTQALYLSAGEHEIRVKGVIAYKYCRWYLNGTWVEDDNSGILATDPSLDQVLTFKWHQNYKIECRVYNDKNYTNWNSTYVFNTDIKNDATLTFGTSWGKHSGSTTKKGQYVYEFYAEKGYKYSIKTGCGNSATANFDTYIAVLNSSCCTYKADDDNTCESGRSKLDFIPSTSGTYYIIVQGGDFNTDYGNFTLAFIRSVICTKPSASVSDATGDISAKLTCNATGGAGGSYQYKWYYGKNCDGSYLGSGSTYNAYGTGYYSCKVSMSMCDETVTYTCAYAYVTINCPEPNTPSVSGITENSVKLSWKNTFSDLDYEVRYKPSSGSTWTTSSVNAATSLNLSSLTPNTTYDWEVRTNCGASKFSSWISGVNFKTYLPPCVNPANLKANNLKPDGADLVWDKVTGASGYEIQYKASSGSTWTTKTTPNNSYSLTGLSEKVTYSWKVRSDCGSQNFSNYTNGSNFTTSSKASMDDLFTSGNLWIVPNPNRGKFTVESDLTFSRDVIIQVVDLYGKVIYTENLNGSSGHMVKEIDLGDQKPGLYYLYIFSDKGLISQKISIF